MKLVVDGKLAMRGDNLLPHFPPNTQKS